MSLLSGVGGLKEADASVLSFQQCFDIVGYWLVDLKASGLNIMVYASYPNGFSCGPSKGIKSSVNRLAFYPENDV